MTSDVLTNVQGQRSKVKVKQRENVVWSPNYCSFYGNRGRPIQWHVRILIGSSQSAVCAHAQYIFGQKQPRSTGTRRRAAFKLQCTVPPWLVEIFYVLWVPLPRFLVCFLNFIAVNSLADKGMYTLYIACRNNSNLSYFCVNANILSIFKHPRRYMTIRFSRREKRFALERSWAYVFFGPFS